MPTPLKLQRLQEADDALKKMMTGGVPADTLQTALASLPQTLTLLGYLQTLALLSVRDKVEAVLLRALIDHCGALTCLPGNQELRLLSARAVRFANSLKVLSKQPLTAGKPDVDTQQGNDLIGLEAIDERLCELSRMGSSTAHQGLRFEKYFSSFRSVANTADAGWRLKWVESFAKKKIGESLALSAHHADMTAIAKTHLGGVAFACTAVSPLVSGLGYEHPIENGFLWHHTLGVPYLPASSVKGMLRAWMDEWCDAIQVESWFGTDKNAGRLTVFDAVPSVPVRLEADVTTPHWGTWGDHAVVKEKERETDKLSFPADWIAPKPVHWLRTEKGSKFTFYLALDKQTTADENKMLIEQLAGALRYIGIGAKTSSGYGRFEPV